MSTAFRERERFFKRKDRSLSDQAPFLIDLHDNGSELARAELVPTAGREAAELREALDNLFPGKSNSNEREPAAFQVRSCPGLIVVTGALSPAAQHALTCHVLRECTPLPSLSNLDTHYLIPETTRGAGGLWNAYESGVHPIVGLRSDHARALAAAAPSLDAIQLPATLAAPSDSLPFSSGQLERRARAAPVDVPLVAEAYEVPYCDANGEEGTVAIDPPVCSSHNLAPQPLNLLVRDWRWSAVGVHYHWDSKRYHRGRSHAMPSKLAALARAVVAHIAPAAAAYPPSLAASYRPEAGIVNVYGPKDSLTAHVDQSEPALAAASAAPPPLVSVSLGLSAVFLVGGPTRDTPPVALLLRSGDVVLLAGPARAAYHGVPRVFPGTCPSHFDALSVSAPLVRSFLAERRLNVNIRQVF